MAMRVSRKEFLGVDELSIPSPQVMTAKMVLDFEAAVYLEMKRQGIKQKDLAKKMGVSAATLSKTLSETSNMTFKTAARIANALGCVLDAPSLRPFDAEEYDTLGAVSETAPTNASATSGESDYKDTMILTTVHSVKEEQSTEQPTVAFMNGEFQMERLAA